MVYESRTYALSPGRLPEYLSMLHGDTAVLSLLAPHLVGFWIAESGSLNAAHHLWRYEDRTDRARARSSLAAEPAMQRFLSRAAPLLQSQHSSLMQGVVLSPDTPPERSPSGVFDRVSMALHLTSGKNEIQHQVRLILTETFQTIATLERRMFEQGGPSCELLLVLRSDSLAQRDDRWANAHRRLQNVDFVSEAGFSSQLLLPTAFSPWR